MVIVRRIMGAPDYERYVRHMSRNHPECTVLTKNEFVRDRLNARYAKPGSRCC
jgi:uncharacterized short protein YbdD (DUF466 family)